MIALVFIIVVVSVGVTIGVVMTYAQTSNTTREIRRLPLGSVARLGAGERAKLVGVARGTGAQVTAPNAGTACLAYCSTGYLGDDGDNKCHMMAPFALETDGGTISIAEPPDGQLVVESTELALAAPGSKPAFGASIVARESVNVDASTSVYEEMIIDGMRIAVVGTVELADGKPRLVGTAKRPLLISSKPKSLQ